MHVEMCIILFHLSLRLSPFFFILFSLFFGLWNPYWSIFNFTNSFFCKFKSTMESLLWFFFNFSYSSTREFPLDFNYHFYLFTNILYLIQYYQHTLFFNHAFLYFSEHVHNDYFEIFFLLNMTFGRSHRQFLLSALFFSVWVIFSCSFVLFCFACLNSFFKQLCKISLNICVQESLVNTL